MSASRSRGNKKRFITRDSSRDDEEGQSLTITPAVQQSVQLLQPGQMLQQQLEKHHTFNFQADTDRSSIPDQQEPQEQHQQLLRRQLTTPQFHRRHAIRSPSLNSPRADRRPAVEGLNRSHGAEFGSGDSSRLPRSPLSPRRFNAHDSTELTPQPSNRCPPATSHLHPQRALVFPRDTEPVLQRPEPHVHNLDTFHSYSDIYRRHSNDTHQGAPSSQCSRASVESDTSFNRCHTSSTCSPLQGATANASSLQQCVGAGATNNQQALGHTRVDSVPQWQGAHFEPHGLNISSLATGSREFNDATKARSSSLTDPVSNNHQPAPLPKVQFPQRYIQSQSVEHKPSQKHLHTHRPRASLDDELTQDRNKNFEVVMRTKSKQPSSTDRRSFYDNDSLPESSDRQSSFTDVLPAAGNTWKSQTAPSSLSVFKRPVYGKIAQVVLPHLAGVFDPRKCLPLKQSHSNPSNSTNAALHRLSFPEMPRGSEGPADRRSAQYPNNVPGSHFRYSDPMSRYDEQSNNSHLNQFVGGNKIKPEPPVDPKQLNQFLSLYSGPWSKEKSLFGRANAAKEAKKLEPNWKKYEEYQNPHPSSILAKGKTQKQLDDHVEMMEKLKQKPETGAEAGASQRVPLSRSHESIEPGQEQPAKSRENLLGVGSPKSRSQELPTSKKELLKGKKKFLIRSPAGGLWQPPQHPDVCDEPGPTTCVSMKQVTLNVPEREASTSQGQSPDPFGSPDHGVVPSQATGATSSDSSEVTRLHTSRLLFHPANSISPRLVRRDVQSTESWGGKQNSSDSGSEFVSQGSTEKFISSVTIPECDLFKHPGNQKLSSEEVKAVLSLQSEPPRVSAGKLAARKTKSDAAVIGCHTPVVVSSAAREPLTNSASSPRHQAETKNYFTFPCLDESTPFDLSSSPKMFLSNEVPSNRQATDSDRLDQSPATCVEVFEESFAVSRLDDLKQPTQSSDLSSSSTSLSLGESSFAAFCRQQQELATLQPAESDDVKTPTNPGTSGYDQRPQNEEVASVSLTSKFDVIVKARSLSKQDSFNSPDSPLFHKTLPLPKDSVILHHRRHHLKECSSFQSSSSSSEDSDLENLSALRLTPRRPRKNKQRTVV